MFAMPQGKVCMVMKETHKGFGGHRIVLNLDCTNIHILVVKLYYIHNMVNKVIGT